MPRVPQRKMLGLTKPRKEQPGHVTEAFTAEPAVEAAVEDYHPEDQALREQNLPETAEVQILKALVSEPSPCAVQPAADTSPLFDKRGLIEPN